MSAGLFTKVSLACWMRKQDTEGKGTVATWTDGERRTEGKVVAAMS